MRKGLAMQQTIGILFSIIVVALIWFVFVYRFPGALPWGCDYDGICENSYTEGKYMYDDRRENDILIFIPFNCWKTDCCYDLEHAVDMCGVEEPSGDFETWYNTLTDEERNCVSKSNIEVLIDCAESRFVCDNETCVQSCNYNDVCEPGETMKCYDCW